MADSESIISGVTSRYASSLFELALAEKKIPAVEKDLARFDELINGSDDLKRFVSSPVFSGDEQFRAVDALLNKAKITGLVGNFVRVVCRNRRLFAMPDMLRAFRKLVAEYQGEATAQVTVAQKLTAAQEKQLKTTLKGVVGKDVAIDATVDPSILGGMIVKVGSRQIDTSLKSRLSSLKLALKEVG